MTGYELSRHWFKFSATKKEARSKHTALFFWIVEKANIEGWPNEFYLHSDECMNMAGIGNRGTYLTTLKDLEKWKFIKVIHLCKNQYDTPTTVKICRSNFGTTTGTSKGKALVQAKERQRKSTEHIYKPIVNNNKPSKPKETLGEPADFPPTPEQLLFKVNQALQDPLPPKPEIDRKKVPPPLEWVIEYFKEKGYSQNEAEHFHDHHTARGWILTNGKKCKDWQAAARTWFSNIKKFNNGTKHTQDLSNASGRFSEKQADRYKDAAENF